MNDAAGRAGEGADPLSFDYGCGVVVIVTSSEVASTALIGAAQSNSVSVELYAPVVQVTTGYVGEPLFALSHCTLTVDAV